MTFFFCDTSGIVWNTKFEEDRLVGALLFFNLSRFLKNNTRQRKDGKNQPTNQPNMLGISFHVSSLWNLPCAWVGLSKYSFPAEVSHVRLKSLAWEVAGVGLEKAGFSSNTNCFFFWFALGVSISVVVSMTFFQSFHWQLDWIPTTKSWI